MRNCTARSVFIMKIKNKEGSMSKEDVIETEGKVVEVLPKTLFRVVLNNGHEIVAYLGGKLRVNNIRILEGDKVKIEMSPYDLTKGRIIYRNK